MTMPNTATVYVDHHQFTLGAVDADTLDTHAEGAVIDAGPGFVNISTGIAYGPVTISIEVAETAPDDTTIDAWEAVEETTVESTTPLRVMRLDGELEPGFDPIPPGRYRLRAHARGRDANWDLDVTEPSEEYWLRLWPTPDADAAIRQLRKTDAAYSPPQKVIPTLDESYTYVRTADGGLKKVPLESPEVKEFRGRWRDWEASRQGTELAGNVSAWVMSGLDRDLVDAIAAIAPQRQQELARWITRRAFERAGLDAVADFRDALDVMDQPGTPSQDLVSQLSHRIETDPAIPLTVVGGMPGGVEHIAQRQALGAYGHAVWMEEPHRMVFDALRSAASVYGMDYVELFERIRREFLQNSNE